MRHSVRLTFALWFAFILSTVSISGSAAPVPVVDLQSEVRGTVYETIDADQTRAEEIFAAAEAAVYFPSLRRVRSLVSSGAATALGKTTAVGTRTHREFTDEIERDFPRFRSNAHGAYLLKQPAMMTGNAKPIAETESVPAAPLASVFTDSFESGMTNWSLDNNTLDLYSWGATMCEARTGTHSADAMRGGVNTLTCSDAYGPNVTTTMMHKSCEAIQGASQAWLDAYIRLATESGGDTLGFYYAGADGLGYGYEFSGTASVWFHVVFNLKQWNRIGDLTTSSCSALAVQFRSNATTQPGFGARIDDLTIGNAAPGFLTASITAMPSSGTVPLTVNFTPAVAGATSAATYQWSFGDAAITTATTPAASFTYTTPGDYWARLRVDDASTGVRAYAHTLIHATSASICSVTCTASAPATVAARSSALFQATATATGCSGAPSYSWTFGDGQSSTQQNASHTYAAAGTYNWTLTTSISGTSCTKSGSITVAATGGGSRRRAVRPPSGSGDQLASATIGTSGGTLSGGGVTLTVPAGAFGSSATLSLMRTSRARNGGDLSDTLAVQGLPNTLAADLSINVDLDSAPPALAPGESIYVSFGGLAMDRDLSVRSMPFLIPATVSGRNVKATLPKSWGSGALASAKNGRIESQAYTGCLTGCHELKVVRKIFLSSDHFNIYFPSAYLSAAQISLSTLEEAFQRLTAHGFSWGCREASGGFVKIPVYLASLGTGEKDPIGDHNSRLDPCGTGWVFTDFIQLNTDYPADGTPMRGAIGHELFHSLQELYLPTTLTNPNRALWIKEASSVWFETIFVPGSCPGVMTGEFQFAWRGLFNPTGSAVEGSGRRRIQNHGYGAAALLKYRTDASPVLNDPFVRTIWDNLKSGNSEFAAFQSAVGSSVPDFWTKFSKDYFVGKVCRTSPLTSRTVEITDASTLPQTFKFSAYPLSSIAFALNLRGLTITDKTPLTITAAGLTDGQKVFIYATKGGSELGQLTKAVSSYTIPDITAYNIPAYTGGHIVMTFVDANLPAGDANSQNSTNEVTLSLGPPAPLFKGASISFAAMGTFSNGTSKTFVIQSSGHAVFNACVFTGSTFSCTWSGSSGIQPPCTGRMTLVFNSKYDTVQTFAYDEVCTLTDGSFTYSRGLTGGNIPMVSDGNFWVGSPDDACPHVTRATFSETWAGSDSYTLVSYSCTTVYGSSLSISLYR